MARALLALTHPTTQARPASALPSRRVLSMLRFRTFSNNPSSPTSPGSSEYLGVHAQNMVVAAGTTQAATNDSDSTSGHASTCIIYRGKQFSVPKGTKLRTAMLLNGVSPHNGKAKLINCRGLGTCGTCAVEIKGEVLPSSWTTAEQLRLNFPPHKPPNNQRLRLACQVACEGAALEVIKRNRFWGEGDVVLGPAGAEDFSLPLGQLEFVLDRERTR